METDKIGLKVRPRKDGSTAYYWVASAVTSKAKDYPQKTVRLHGDMEEIAITARRLTAELKQWLSAKGLGPQTTYDKKLRSLITLYRTIRASTYFEISAKTRESYDYALDILEAECGDRRLDRLTGLDIKEWYAHFREPAEETEQQLARREQARLEGVILPPPAERPRRAYLIMQILRIVVGFGVISDIDECFRLKHILEEMRFSVPKARNETITFEQVQAICQKAIEKNLLSIAIAQALQFELTLRQVDVIGMWEKVEDHASGGILDRGQRWSGGLLWSHLDQRGVLKKVTTKVDDVVAEHDTMQYPFLRSILDMVPAEKRFGPMIKSEATGLPYRRRYFADVWRSVAEEAGVPRSVWNRDSRAGGVTEGSDAGADLEHLRHHANHKNAATTQRYNRSTLEKTREVARLRVASRKGRNGAGT